MNVDWAYAPDDVLSTVRHAVAKPVDMFSEVFIAPILTQMGSIAD